MLLRRGILEGQTGSSLTLLVVAMPLLLGVLGLVVDTGVYGLALIRLSSAADSAALAAASAVDFAHYAETNEVRLDPALAQERARAFAMANFEGHMEITVTIDSENPRRVRIKIRSTVPTLFLTIFGKSEATLEAGSEAQVG